MPVSRKLTTILVMDVVGYSQLMAVDEEGTLAALNAIRQGIIHPNMRRFNGRTVKLMGDGALLEFASAVDAVRFSVDTQNNIAEHNVEVPEERRITFRIGINIGDVVVEEDDLHGNGVNVAARLESLSDAGGVCLSEAVIKHVKGKVNAEFEDAGMQQVKNIPEAVHVFRIIMPDRGTTAGHDDGTESENDSESLVDIDLSMPDTPSIAVLPFNNMSADPEQEYFSDGITEDIITALSKINGLMVISRNSTFVYKGQPVDIKQVSKEQGVRYVLEGSVRKAGDRIRINAQLIDATTGHHLWAERYDRQLEDIFAVQDEITREVTIALDVRLGWGEQAISWSRGTSSLEAWELVRQAMDAVNNNTLGATRKARELCKRALELDPAYAMAWVMQGHCHHQMADESNRHGFMEAQEKELSLAMDCGAKALELDPNLADAYGLLSICHLTDFDYDQALETSKKALDLAPHNAENLGMAAIIHNKAGLPERGLELIRMAMRYCPVYPLWFLWSMGMSYRAMDRLDKAITIFEAAVSQDFEYLSVHVSLASAYGEAGQLDKAKATAAEVLRQNPKFSVSRYMSGLAYRNSRDLERFEHGLRKAGLPE